MANLFILCLSALSDVCCLCFVLSMLSYSALLESGSACFQPYLGFSLYLLSVVCCLRLRQWNQILLTRISLLHVIEIVHNKCRCLIQMSVVNISVFRLLLGLCLHNHNLHLAKLGLLDQEVQILLILFLL